MMQKRTTGGRPTFRIDAARLRALRTEAGLTQMALATKVYARAGKSSADVRVMKTNAYRWEKSGTVPLEIANHLAEELNTTTAVLQGALPAPASGRVEEIEQGIRRLLAAGATSDLSAELEQCKGESQPERVLASRLASRWEAAQLSQAQEEFEVLGKLTGLSVRELRQPMSHEGFWLLIANGLPGSMRSEILFGIASLRDAVRREVQDCLNGSHESDAHVSFMEEKEWFRATIAHARIPKLVRTLRFVRCQPTESGLQWASPTWQDRLWLEALPSEAYAQTNFVTGFDGVRVPTEITSLRLAIIKNPGLEVLERSGADAQREILAIVDGVLSKMPVDRFETSRREGGVHDFVVGCLASGLWERLLPLLSDWPLECWRFSLAQSRIDVHLDVPYRIYAGRPALPPLGNRISVSLVELTTDGVLKRAPWRRASVIHIQKMLERSLHEAQALELNRHPGFPSSQ